MKLDKKFYTQDALRVAPALIGKLIVRKLEDGNLIKARITEVEVYLNEKDTASHARFGKTPRNKIMYEEGGLAYIYICYGIHFLLNVITGNKNNPQGVMIRAIEGYVGPGKLTKHLKIDLSLNYLDLSTSEKLWLEDDNFKCKIKTDKRIGIEYATEEYRNKKWRFIMK